MLRFIPSLVVLLLLVGAPLPALAGDDAQQTNGAVKWVYEGCVAYPVTAEAVTAPQSRPQTDALAQAGAETKRDK